MTVSLGPLNSCHRIPLDKLPIHLTKFLQKRHLLRKPLPCSIHLNQSVHLPRELQ
ncbi:MAG: hypothetical protein E7Z75_06265 [Methanobrevibacter olleyae]|uniref:CHHC U11-48K-type domain-containing protein n=1 Tax=Methanobrevibacter olleyae TaxID=294671 RepID=A0A8T3VPS4_METOL|nr:hypothetical protein [Methanobrevibacter olleyae]